MNKIIKIENHNPSWSKIFQEIKTVLLSKIAEDILSIEHVGSTSVVGLKAKPILDIDVVIKDDEEIQALVIKKLKTLGYHHIGNLGITGREAFRKENEFVPFTKEPKNWMAHNFYVCKQGSIGLQNHILFRNYLIANPEAVETYGKLKQDLAEKFPYDIDKYINGKTDFITSILAKQGLESKTVDLISKENLSN